MNTCENQKVITTNAAQHNKNNIYATLNIEAMSEAMTLLKPNTFKLWCYMAKNQNNYKFALSCVDACKFCGFTKNTFHNSVNELINVGYLVNTSGNAYDFYEKLPKQEVLEITVKKSDDFTF